MLPRFYKAVPWQMTVLILHLLYISTVSFMYVMQFKNNHTINALFFHSGVWLECNTSVTVQARNTVTLYCTIHSRDGNFVGDGYSWEEGANTICNNTWKKERCEWDNRTYVWLTIQDVVKESEYTVWIKGPSGRDDLSIKVQVNESEYIPRVL